MKGEGRPVLAQEERSQIIASLSTVDYVTGFDEETPIALIEAIRPDVLVKGEDWKEKGVVGTEFVESYGGKVVLAPIVEGASTSDIVTRIARNSDPGE